MSRRRTRAFLLAAFALTFQLMPSEAAAYCQTRTCRKDCELDAKFCVSSGLPLYWASSCVTFSVQRAGSTKHLIDATTLEQAAQAAFDTWRQVDCGGGKGPTIEVTSLGQVDCGNVEYNQDHGNANILVFRDELWPPNSSGDALALTTVWYDPTSGRIYDVDMEINGTTTPITATDPQDGADLASILTHEAGHFLGLSHSGVSSSVMRPFYNPGGDSLRRLHADDVAGICSAYPPSRVAESSECTPRHGFASDCAGSSGCCSLTPGRSDGNGNWALLGFAVVAGVSVGRRRRARTRSRDEQAAR